MKKLTLILMVLFIGFSSCSDDDDDPVDTCAEYAKKFEREASALDPTDFEGAITLSIQFMANLPEGCEYLLDE